MQIVLVAQPVGNLDYALLRQSEPVVVRHCALIQKRQCPDERHQKPLRQRRWQPTFAPEFAPDERHLEELAAPQNLRRSSYTG